VGLQDDNYKKDTMSDIHPKVKKYFRKKHGASIAQGQAHENAHEEWDRRTFLKMTGMAALGSALMLNNSAVQAFAPSNLLNSLGAADCGDRILVLVRLKGGNDGLNTVILRGNDEYYNIRPTLAVQESGLWALSDDYGMPNEMQSLQPLWEEGKMRIVHNVGYPEPNYSHFRSSDIWASASDSNELVTSGWIGRMLDRQFPAFQTASPVIPPALQIGIQANMIFRSDFGSMALAISNPAEFYQLAQTGQLYSTDLLGQAPNEKELAFARTVANSAFRYSESIQGAYNTGSNQAAYPGNYLAEQLAIIARLIKGNLGTKVYMVSIDGFDTHSTQANAHPILIQYVADSIKAFLDDLGVSGHDENVLAMTFSEFGRTIYENGSQGTDHGTGAPMMLFGKDIGSGFHGEAPDLVNVDMYGDPLFSVDFRSVYSTVLTNWLCLPEEVASNALGQSFGLVEDLLPPSSPPVGSNQVALLLGHKPLDDLPGTAFEIDYSIKQRGQVRIVLLNQSGQAVRVLSNKFHERGSHKFVFRPGAFFLPAGEYFYRLEAGGMMYSRRIKW
jgi:uncharacterized protein (DUF1501 family)